MNDKTIRAEGDIVYKAIPDLREKIKEQINAGVTKLTIDLSQVEIIDSMGIALLVKSQNSLKQKNGSLRLINIKKTISQMFRMMHLHNHLEIIYKE